MYLEVSCILENCSGSFSFNRIINYYTPCYVSVIIKKKYDDMVSFIFMINRMEVLI